MELPVEMGFPSFHVFEDVEVDDIKSWAII